MNSHLSQSLMKSHFPSHLISSYPSSSHLIPAHLILWRRWPQLHHIGLLLLSPRHPWRALNGWKALLVVICQKYSHLHLLITCKVDILSKFTFASYLSVLLVVCISSMLEGLEALETKTCICIHSVYIQFEGMLVILLSTVQQSGSKAENLVVE